MNIRNLRQQVIDQAPSENDLKKIREALLSLTEKKKEDFNKYPLKSLIPENNLSEEDKKFVVLQGILTDTAEKEKPMDQYIKQVQSMWKTCFNDSIEALPDHKYDEQAANDKKENEKKQAAILAKIQATSKAIKEYGEYIQQLNQQYENELKGKSKPVDDKKGDETPKATPPKNPQDEKKSVPKHEQPGIIEGSRIFRSVEIRYNLIKDPNKKDDPGYWGVEFKRIGHIRSSDVISDYKKAIEFLMDKKGTKEIKIKHLPDSIVNRGWTSFGFGNKIESECKAIYEAAQKAKGGPAKVTLDPVYEQELTNRGIKVSKLRDILSGKKEDNRVLLEGGEPDPNKPLPNVNAVLGNKPVAKNNDDDEPSFMPRRGW